MQQDVRSSFLMMQCSDCPTQVPPPLQERDAISNRPADGNRLQVRPHVVRGRIGPWCCPRRSCSQT